MSVGSVNTNTAAYVALQSLNTTQSSLGAAQKQISTGYRVADATDDGGAFAVAQKVRSDVSALTTVNQQLGTAQGLVTTAVSSLTSISNVITQAKATLVKIADGGLADDQRDQYITSYQELVSQVADYVDNATYNGQTLLGAASGPVTPASKQVINNEDGATSTINAEDVSTLPDTLAALIGGTFSRDSTGVDTFTTPSPSTAQTAALAALQTGAAVGYDSAQLGVSNQLNQAAADSNYLSAQITFNTDKIDSLNQGLGALIDADLSQESAVLQSLQIKQQLGTQALSIANQSPQSLLSLFK